MANCDVRMDSCAYCGDGEMHAIILVLLFPPSDASNNYPITFG